MFKTHSNDCIFLHNLSSLLLYRNISRSGSSMEMEPSKFRSLWSMMVMPIKSIFLFKLSSFAFSSWERLCFFNLLRKFIKLNAQIKFNTESAMKASLIKLSSNKINDWIKECLLDSRNRRLQWFSIFLSSCRTIARATISFVRLIERPVSIYFTHIEISFSPHYR